MFASLRQVSRTLSLNLRCLNISNFKQFNGRCMRSKMDSIQPALTMCTMFNFYSVVRGRWVSCAAQQRIQKPQTIPKLDPNDPVKRYRMARTVTWNFGNV